MKNWFTWVVIYLLGLSNFCLVAQTNSVIKEVDAINNLTFEEKIAHPSISIKKYQQLLVKAQKAKYASGIADTYANLALISYYQGKFEKHTQYSLEAIKMHTQLHQLQKLCRDYAEYGYQLKKRDLQQAIFYMQKGKTIAESHNYEFELRGIYDNYGVLKEMNKELDSALFFYQKSLQLKENAKDLNGIPYSLNNIAGIFLFQKKYTEAKQFLDQAYQNRKSRNDKMGVCENLSFYGNYYKAIGNLKEAIHYYKLTVAECEKNEYKDLQRGAYLALSDLFESENQPKLALQNLRKYQQLNDSLNGIQLKQKQVELDAEFQTEEKEKQLLASKADNAQKKVLLIGIGSLLLCSVLIGYLVYFRQKSKANQLEKEVELQAALAAIEVQNKLQEQRVAISRDLHDNIGSQLTFIISSVENIKYFIGDKNDKVFGRLSKIGDFTKDTISELRDTIWAMNKEAISFEDLLGRISNFVNQAKIASEAINIELINSLTEDFKKEFTSKEGIYMYRIIQESINNAVKYAQAANIKVLITGNQHVFQIVIEDDGNGFNPNEIVLGNGILNMQKRAEDIGGTCEINSVLEKGTKIIFRLT